MKRVFVVVALALASACGSTATSPSASVSVAFSKTDLTVGAGTTATSGHYVSVNYTGWLYDATKPDNKGVQFDTSAGRGVFTFLLGAAPSQVIQGWDQGVVGMQVGGTRRLVIPPSLGYGADPTGPIPGNSTLVFDVTLVAVQ